MFDFRQLSSDQLGKIADLDRSEQVAVGYRVADGELRPYAVDWDIPAFRPDGPGDHTIPAHVRFCEGHLRAGARALGAFDGDRLIGIGLMTPEIRPGLAQLAYLHVSREYRRGGVAARLLDELLHFARETGARRIYVSSTPSESAVGFYRSRGFRLTTPLPELFELEPEDIHMILELPDDSPSGTDGAHGGR